MCSAVGVCFVQSFSVDLLRRTLDTVSNVPTLGRMTNGMTEEELRAEEAKAHAELLEALKLETTILSEVVMKLAVLDEDARARVLDCVTVLFPDAEASPFALEDALIERRRAWVLPTLELCSRFLNEAPGDTFAADLGKMCKHIFDVLKGQDKTQAEGLFKCEHLQDDGKMCAAPANRLSATDHAPRAFLCDEHLEAWLKEHAPGAPQPPAA